MRGIGSDLSVWFLANKLPNVAHAGNKPMGVYGSFSTGKLNYTSPDVKNRTMVNPRLDLISIQCLSQDLVLLAYSAACAIVIRSSMMVFLYANKTTD